MSDFSEQFLEPPHKSVVSVSLDNELLAYLEKLQQKIKLSRSTIINCILNKYKNENQDL